MWCLGSIYSILTDIDACKNIIEAHNFQGGLTISFRSSWQSEVDALGKLGIVHLCFCVYSFFFFLLWERICNIFRVVFFGGKYSRSEAWKCVKFH